MARGRKTGGRTKGTPNKDTSDLVERLRVLDCDPLEGMVQIATNEAYAPELRGRMYAELAQYLYPKRRATEVKVDDGPQVIFHIGSEFEQVTATNAV